MSYKPLRVSEAARILNLSPGTVRNWCKQGKLEYSLSVSGQKVFDREYIYNLARETQGLEPITVKPVIFYARSSDGNDVTINTQIEKLTQSFGKPDKVYKDKASGLNDSRRGLRGLLNYCKKNPSHVYITNKDRITRFGYSYLEELLESYGSTLTVLDSDETKEPMEVLMQDFMSLFTSFTGKFYRVRGYEQQKKFLKDIDNTIKEKREQ